MLSINCRFYFGCNYFHFNQVHRRIICAIHLSNHYNNYAKYLSSLSIYCEWLVSWVYPVCHVDNCNHMTTWLVCPNGLYFLWSFKWRKWLWDFVVIYMVLVLALVCKVFTLIQWLCQNRNWHTIWVWWPWYATHGG